MLNVHGICTEWLKAHGFDGLAGDECGCEISDLMPCDEPMVSCEAGHKRICSECKDKDVCELKAAYDCDWCISTRQEAE